MTNEISWYSSYQPSSQETAELQDELFGGLVGLARSADNSPFFNDSIYPLIREALIVYSGSVDGQLIRMSDAVHAFKHKLSPDCGSCGAPCGRTSDYEMERYHNAEEKVKALKTVIIFGLQDLAVSASEAAELGKDDPELNSFFLEALFKFGYEESTENLITLLEKLGSMELRVQSLLEEKG